MASDSHPHRSGRLLSFLAVLWVALSSAFKIGGNDIWWHIRTGRWIWEHGSLPGTDPFSHTAPGPWSYTDWLSQLLLYGLDWLGGADVLVAGKMLLVAGMALALLAICNTRAGPAALALSVGAMAMHMRLVLKPELFSFLFFALVMLVLFRVNAGKKRYELFIVPVLLAAWANFHRAGTISLVLLAAAGIAWGVDRRKRYLLTTLGLVSVLSLAALCLNPAGGSYLVAAFRLSVSPTLRQGVAEWAPLSLALPWASVPCFVVLAAGWLAGWLARRRRIDLQSLVVLATGVLAFRSVRFVPYAAMAMIPGLAGDLERLADLLSRRLAGSVRRGLVDLSLATSGLAALAAFYLGVYPPALRGTGAADWLLPVEVAGFLKRHPPPGKMWNSLNQGGYLIYALAPGKKVFIDGRGDTVYPRSFYEETLRASRDHRVLLAQLERHRIGFAVVEYGGERLPPGSIFDHPDWVLVWWGDRSAVLVRRSQASRDYLDGFGYRELKVDTVLARLEELPGDPRGRELAGEILANLRRAPGSIRAHYLAGRMFCRLGRQEDCRKQRRVVDGLRAARDLEFPLP